MTTMLLSTCSHLRCSSAVPNFGRQEFGLQEESVGGADTLALQARPRRLGNGKNTAGKHSRLTADRQNVLISDLVFLRQIPEKLVGKALYSLSA